MIEKVRDSLREAREFIAARKLCLEATVDDYPIGRRDRGKCKLYVERKQGKGYRPVKQTTNKCSHWCKPRAGIYRGYPVCVIHHRQNRIGFLEVSTRGVFVTEAAGQTIKVAEAPHYTKPNRVEQSFNVVSHNLMTGEKINESPIVIKADPPELCDAWDEWEKGVDELQKLVLQVWQNCCICA